MLTTPAHQFALPEGLGNRVLAYSTEGTGGVLHTHIDQLVHELKKQNMRVIKLMTLFSWFVDKENPTAPTSYAQGGTLKEILADSVGATWHSGGYSAGFDEKGRPTTVKSDWPTDYGPLTDKAYISYNAHLVGIDYQGGVRRPIPAETLAAYYRNADLWDVAAALTVPFVDEDKDPIYREYYYNPLEGYDRRTLQRVANNMAKLSKEQFLKQNGAFYCSEGQFTVANLGPQEYSLVKKRAFGNTALGKLIDTFNAAPGYKDKPIEERRRNPIDRLELSQAARAREGRHQRGAVRARRGDAAHRHLSRVRPRGRARLADLRPAREGRPDRASDDGRHHGLEPAAPLHAARGRCQRHQRRRACAPIAPATPT